MFQIQNNVLVIHALWTKQWRLALRPEMNRAIKLNSMSSWVVSLCTACSHRRHKQDKTVLSCPHQWCEHNCRQDKFSVIFNIFETEQLQIGNWVETTQNCLVLSPIVFTLPIRTRQDKTILSCPCQWCEQAISVLHTPQYSTMMGYFIDGLQVAICR